MSLDDDLDRAIGDWLLRKETAPNLLPGEFARELPEGLRSPFLQELEELAVVDGLATQAPPRDLPRRYGDFRVLGELGRGAMGAVYDAEQVSTGRRVALKVMHPHVARDLQSASRFQREARTAAALRHPGIVPVLSFGETDGTSWLAMERVEGRSLQRLLSATADARDVDNERARSVLGNPRQLARALADAADALDFAHRHHVVHRDVKPANLMYTDDGRVVVLDFGLATTRDADAVTLTRTGDFLGTPLYMAPEQAVGAENGTPQSDVYALGAVLYECLCGRPPIRPGPLATVIDAILNRDPVAPRRVRPGVPEDLARIAMQCLEKESHRRYATAAALADDLRRFVDGNSVHARHSGVLHRSLRRLRRRPALAVLAALVCLLLPTAAIAWGVAAHADRQAVELQRRHDLDQIDALLGRAPERITLFGGASLRFYARLGLGEQIADGAGRRSPEATAALQLAQSVVQRHPDDLVGLRAHAAARLDVGDEPQHTEQALAAVLAHPDANASDRMMMAVFERQRGREDAARTLRATVTDDDPTVAFWLGFWHQAEQNHAGAIAAFSLAIDRADLPTEQRYWALLHRGWCLTCPDVGQMTEAQEDLVAAATLRPRYGTARLLWATLRCLGATRGEELDAPVKAVTEVLRDAEPWLHVLTARVLLAVAEGGIAQSGPVHFGAEFSPITVMPVQPAFATAFANLGLDLLDGVLKKAPQSFEAAFHRITALALLDRHAEALALADTMRATFPSNRAVIELQRARVHLAAGSPQRASAAVQGAVAADPRLVAAWRFQAILSAHVGDVSGEAAALDRAIALLANDPLEASVFPDAAVWLPELQLARARALRALGRRDEAITTLQNGPFGGVLAGEHSARVGLQRNLLLAELGAPSLPVVAIGKHSPLRWLREPTAAFPEAVDASLRIALHREWLPSDAAARLPNKGASVLAATLQRRGVQAPSNLPSAPLQSVLANVVALLAEPAGDENLLALADALLTRDPEHGEARLLRALVLYLTKRSAEAMQYLTTTLEAHADDLRCRYLLAVAARDAGDQPLLRLALRRGRALLTASELDGAAAPLRLPSPVAGTALLAALE